MPRLPLARTHRPQRFADVLGQQVPVRALGAAAASGEVASAYIFSGTRGIGKTTLARIFAKTLNCQEGPAADCCDRCTACREIAEGRALDVLELDAATHTGIDDIRELREAAQYPPGRDRYRVFILDEAHQLSTSAWNGLLKILEEPPAWCVFVFCTTEPHKIPATIESRALHFAFRSPTPAQLREHLARVAEKEQIPVDPDALDLLAQAADGSVRDGLSALDQVRALAGGPITREAVRGALGLIPGEAVGRYVAALGAGDALGALSVLAQLDEEGQDLRAFAAEVLERIRRLALAAAAGPDALPRGTDLAGGPEATPTLGPPLQIDQLVWMGRVIDQLESRLRQGGAQRALFDLATVRMTRMADLTPLAELVDRLGGQVTGPGPGPRGGGRAGDIPMREPERRPPASPPERRPANPPQRPWSGVGAGTATGAASASGAAPESVPPPEPEPAREPEPAPTPRASAAPVAGGNLLDRLSERVSEIRPAAAVYLRHVDAADLLPSGTLRLRLAPGREVFAPQLTKSATQEALLEAASRATGEPVVALDVQTGPGAAGGSAGVAALGSSRAGGDTGGGPGRGPGSGPGRGPGGAPGRGNGGGNGGGNGIAAPRSARREALDRARKDPLVRAIFDEFGATFVDGQLLPSGAPGSSSPYDPPGPSGPPGPFGAEVPPRSPGAPPAARED